MPVREGGDMGFRILLAALLIRANDGMSFDQVVHELWGDTPPRTAATQVHGYVMRVRRAIGDPRGHRLVTAAPGYRLVVGSDDVDARRAREIHERTGYRLDDERVAAVLTRCGRVAGGSRAPARPSR